MMRNSNESSFTMIVDCNCKTTFYRLAITLSQGRLFSALPMRTRGLAVRGPCSPRWGPFAFRLLRLTEFGRQIDECSVGVMASPPVSYWFFSELSIGGVMDTTKQSALLTVVVGALWLLGLLATGAAIASWLM